MKNSKEIAKLLLSRQDEHEAVVRALHMDEFSFLKWAFDNQLLVAFAIGSVGMEFIPGRDKDDAPVVLLFALAKLLYHEIHSTRKEIIQHFNTPFNVIQTS